MNKIKDMLTGHHAEKSATSGTTSGTTDGLDIAQSEGQKAYESGNPVCSRDKTLSSGHLANNHYRHTQEGVALVSLAQTHPQVLVAHPLVSDRRHQAMTTPPPLVSVVHHLALAATTATKTSPHLVFPAAPRGNPSKAPQESAAQV
jgi:hypothetical protein